MHLTQEMSTRPWKFITDNSFAVHIDYFIHKLVSTIFRLDVTFTGNFTFLYIHLNQGVIYS